MRMRRDPRAERDARQVADAGRRRFTLKPPPSAPAGRLRRDPRALRNAATVMAGTRPRIEWRGAQTSPAAALPPQRAAAAPALEPAARIIADPAFLVLAVTDHPGGALGDHDRQLIAAARLLADAGGGAVAVLAADGVDGLGAAGADRVIPLPAGMMAEYDPEGRTAATLAAMVMLSPRYVLFTESPDGGAEVARRVAAASGERLFPGLEGIAGGRASRRMGGGRTELQCETPRLLSVAGDAFPAHDGQPGEARAVEMPAFAAGRRIEGVARLALDADGVALSEADFILSAGNGITDWEGFAALAGVLGATRGGSRVVCDEGHLPRDRQVGASGTVVTARCYFALGISGAPQHLQGITEVGHVVAVNTDLHAEMIKRADLAIIADAQEVMPALVRHAKERGHG